MALRKQPKTAVDALRAQRQELVARLAKAETRAANMDPLDQWEELSQLTSEIQSLERAIATADNRIAVAERDAAAAAVAERDAERSAAARSARANLEAQAQRVCDELQRLDASLLPALDAAARGLALCGGYPGPQIGPALEIRRAVRLTLDRWRGLSPTWFGLPEPPSPAERAKLEEAERLKRLEARLADLRQLQNRERFDAGAGETTNVSGRIAETAALVALSRERLSAP